MDPHILADRSEEELQSLLDDPDLLTALYEAKHPLPQKHLQVLQDMERQHEQVLARIQSLRPSVFEQRQKVENSLIQTKRVERDWEQTELQMYASLKPYSSQALFSNLQAAVSDSEKISETVAASFLETGSTAQNEGVQDFIKDYKTVRKTFHLRDERLARWKDGRVGGFR